MTPLRNFISRTTYLITLQTPQALTERTVAAVKKVIRRNQQRLPKQNHRRCIRNNESDEENQEGSPVKLSVSYFYVRGLIRKCLPFLIITEHEFEPGTKGLGLVHLDPRCLLPCLAVELRERLFSLFLKVL